MSETSAVKARGAPYQRWEMAALGEARSQGGPAAASIAKLAQEMMAARDAGQRQGYEAGLLTGHADGLAQGLAQSDAVLGERQSALRALCQEFEQQSMQAREEIASQVLALALDMAHALFKSALVLQPERILPIVTQALQGLPALQQPARLHLHPLDLELVAATQGEALSDAGWRLQADPQLARGGCRLETASNEVDATLETRWRRLQQAFGLKAEDLAPL